MAARVLAVLAHTGRDKVVVYVVQQWDRCPLVFSVLVSAMSLPVFIEQIAVTVDGPTDVNNDDVEADILRRTGRAGK